MLNAGDGAAVALGDGHARIKAAGRKERNVRGAEQDVFESIYSK